MSEAQRWLHSRLGEMPPALRRRVEDAVGAARTGDANSADALRAAAEVLLAQAAHAAPGRDTALALLAADALMTYACEATAEQKPDQLGDLR